MKTDESLGTFDAIAAPHAREVQQIAYGLRALVAKLHPNAVETPRNGERCTTYGVGPKKMSQAYAYISPLTSSVNLGFYHSIALPDPRGLLMGTGKRARHVKLTSIEETRAPAIAALIRAAVQERQASAPSPSLTRRCA